MASGKTMDLTKGSVTKQILLFALPIMLGNILQQLYNIADRVVVGQFAENGAISLAAIGATASATNLIVGLFTGMSVGVNVLCANLLGARDEKGLRRSMHTAVLFSFLCGIVVSLVGILLTKPVLQAMGTPADVFEQAALYMRIYFAGVPVSLLYNFGAGILNAHGDTKRPMMILLISGSVNVVLNVIFVVGFHRSVDGVAWATVISQLVSALMVLKVLFDPKDQYVLRRKELTIHKKELFTIVRIGVPSGLGGIVFSISNLTVQSAVNSFDSAAIIAGRTIALDINALFYQIQCALFATSVSFSGQCFGAGEYKRIDDLALRATLLCLGGYFICAVVCTLFPEGIVSLFNSDAEVVAVGKMILLMSCWGDLLYAPSEIFIGCLRGMRYSVLPTVLNLMGVCVPRLLWIWFVFPLHRTLFVLMLCYPISWAFSSILQGISYWLVRKKMLQTKIS